MRKLIAKKVKNLPYQLISGIKSFNPEVAISLFCDPRGGSTWLAETLNTIPKSMILDEPLHLNTTRQLKEIGFSWRQHIPEHADWEAAKEIFSAILKGKTIRRGTSRRNSLAEILTSRQLILKIIRGKALLPWLVRQFDFKYKPLVLVRHPFAIAASMLSHHAWNYRFQRFQTPDGPYREFYQKHEAFLQSLESKEEQLTALWCMTNNVVLKHPSNNRSWISLNYENLISEPEKYFKQVFATWELPMPEKLLAKVSKPSSTTIGKDHIQTEQLLSGWQNQLSEQQISRLQHVLDYFEVDYYGQAIRPLIPAGEVHLK